VLRVFRCVFRAQASWLVLGVLLLVSWQASSEEAALERTYVWSYAGRTWTITHTFPFAMVESQRSLARTLEPSAYGNYVSDPQDDEVLRGFLDHVERAAVGLNVWERLNLVLALVQSIPYATEPCEYPRYPLETLVDQRGDCEDVAILTVALVREMGFAAVLLAFLEERHVGVGIRVLPPHYADCQAYEWAGDLYYYVEATNPGWGVGQLPPAFRSDPMVIPVPSTVGRTGT